MRLPIALLLGMIVGLSLGLGLHSPSAQAHANLVRSNPAEDAILARSPVEVLLWFSEAVEVKFSKVQIIGPDGERYDNDDLHVHFDTTNPGITVKPDFPPGTYTVVWSMLSAVDGHRTAGTFAFSIGAPSLGSTAGPVAGGVGGASVAPGVGGAVGGSGPPNWLSVLNRWLSFAAMAALLGAASFAYLVLPAGLRAIGRDSDGTKAAARAAGILRSCMLAALILLSGATIITLWLQTWAAGGSPDSWSSMGKVLTETRFGEIWIWRVGLVVAALTISAFSPRGTGDDDFSSYVGLFILPLALAIPATTSLNSHAAAAQNVPAVRTFIDWLHLVASGLWIGGLLQLALITPAVLSVSRHRSEFLAGITRRFSLVAVAAVGVVIVTGALQWWQQLGGVADVVRSGYGYTLLAKVLLLLPVLALGAFNLLIVGPRFLSLARERLAAALARSLRWEGRFRRAVLAEITLAAAILAVTAVLTNSAPPGGGSAGAVAGQSAPTNIVEKEKADDLQLTLVLEPGRVGPNDLSVFLADLDGNPKPVERLILRFKYLDQDLGTTEADANPLHPPDHYVLQTSQLSLPGRWDIEVVVRREGLFDARTDFTIDIGS